MTNALVTAPPSGPVTTEETLRIMEMIREGQSPREIAIALQRSSTTIRKHLKDGRLLLQFYASHAASAWVEAMDVAAAKGDHRPAKDLLIAAKAIDPIGLQEKGGPTVQVQIGIAIPGLPPPVTAGPIIDAEP